MATGIYPKYAQARLNGNVIISSGDIRMGLVRSGAANVAHEFLADLTGAGATIVARSATLTNKTVVNGTFDHDDTTFGTPAAGAPCNAVIWFQHTGSDATARLIAYQDNASGLPVTPDGTTPIPYVVAASGVFAPTTFFT